MPEIGEDFFFLELRRALAPELRNLMAEEMLQASLLNRTAAQLAMDALMAEYEAGIGAPQEFADSFLFRFRTILAGYVAGEGAAREAAAFMLKPCFDPEQPLMALEGFQRTASSPEDRSVFRNARALLLYRVGRPEEAKELLAEEIRDEQLTYAYHHAAEEKLELINQEQDPVGWEEDIIPPELREGKHWERMTEEGLGESEGWLAGSFLIRELNEAGYHERAIQLSQQLARHQEGNFSDNKGDNELAKLFVKYGWVDRAIASLPVGNPIREALLEKYGPGSIWESDCRTMRDQTPDPILYARYHHWLVRRLASTGRAKEAIAESERQHPEGTLTPVLSRVSGLHEVIRGAVYDADKQTYAQQLKAIIDSEEFAAEVSEYERRADDPDIKPEEEKRLRNRINELMNAKHIFYVWHTGGGKRELRERDKWRI